MEVLQIMTTTGAMEAVKYDELMRCQWCSFLFSPVLVCLSCVFPLGRKHLEDASGRQQGSFNLRKEVKEHKESIRARAAAAFRNEKAQQVSHSALSLPFLP